MSFLGLFTSFHGRIGRLTYLGAWFSIFIVSIVSMKLFEATLAPNKALLAQALLSLPLIYLHWAVATKRAHDLDKSGWWLFAWSTAAIPGLITIIVDFITMLAKDGSGSFGLTLILLGIVLIFASFYQVAIHGEEAHDHRGQARSLAVEIRMKKLSASLKLYDPHRASDP